VPERSNGAVSKTVVPFTGYRGFESLPLRHPTPEREMLSGDCLGPSTAVSRDHKTEMFLHRCEIMVIVQQ
jgi:hypothetical protein